jgi:hypothetical protein
MTTDEREAIHVSIYIRENGVQKIGYEIKDNDKSLIFTPTLFRECLESFAKDDGYIHQIKVNSLKERLKVYTTLYAVPEHIYNKIY